MTNEMREIREAKRNLSFADFFFDGVIADYLVQTKIRDAKIQVQDAIQSVSSVLAQLKAKTV